MTLRDLLLFMIPVSLLSFCSSCNTYDEDAIDPAGLDQWKNYSTANVLPDNGINTIFKDESGNIWVGTVGGGAARYDGTGWIAYTMNNGLSSNGIYAIGQDKGGDIWFGTSEGVNILIDNEMYYFHYLDTVVVYSFLNGTDDIFWIGTAGHGLVLYDYNSFYHIPFENPDYNTINVIMQDGSGTVWLGTEGGALYFDGTAWGIYDESNGLGNNDVSDIMEDAWGDLWFSSIDGEFLTRYDGHISEYVRTYGFSQCLVTSLIEDQNRNIWLTSAFGILKYNRAEMITIQLPPEFPDDIIYCSEMDANGNLWFGTFYNGIYFYSTE